MCSKCMTNIKLNQLFVICGLKYDTKVKNLFLQKNFEETNFFFKNNQNIQRRIREIVQ